MKTKIIAAVEVSSCAVKLVIGYVLDGEVIVLNSCRTPLDEGAVVDGDIRDYSAVARAISSTIKEGSAHLASPINEMVLIIPPIGFEVYEHSQTTSVVSAIGQIAKLDVENVLSQVSKARTSDGSMIVDILPDAYVLDQGQSFIEPPLGQISNSLTIRAKLHVCPIHVVNAYKKVFSQANIRYQKLIVAPHAACAVAKNQKGIPSDYLQIDLGARLTSVSLVGQNQVLASTFAYHGLDHLTDKLASTFGLDFKAAQYLKETFGLDERIVNFKAPLFTVISKDKKTKYTADDLRDVMTTMIHDYVEEIDKSIHELAEQTEAAILQLPLVLVGGGIRLHGLAQAIRDQLDVATCLCVESTALGAREPQYTNAVGAIHILGSVKPLEDPIPVSEEEVSVTADKTRKIKTRRISDLHDDL